MTDRLLTTIRTKNEAASGPAMLVGTSEQIFESGQVLEYQWGRGCVGTRKATPEEMREAIAD